MIVTTCNLVIALMFQYMTQTYCRIVRIYAAEKMKWTTDRTCDKTTRNFDNLEGMIERIMIKNDENNNESYDENNNESYNENNEQENQGENSEEYISVQ
uniref:Uncharacterized protein n=1 Tax=Glossina pallidipes TaxID=7398 RepID=A0A1B0A1B3_GLOPL